MNIKGGVADDQKVRKLLGSFKNTLIQDWMSTETDRLIQLSFTDFMDEFRERWLPTNWEQNVLTQMLGSHLDPARQTFEAWASQILSHNVSLRKTKSHMTEEALRRQLEIMLDEELRTLACEANVAEIAGLREWMTKVKELDNRRQIDLKRMAQFFDAASMRAASNRLLDLRVRQSSHYSRGGVPLAHRITNPRRYGISKRPHSRNTNLSGGPTNSALPTSSALPKSTYTLLQFLPRISSEAPLVSRW